MTRLPQAIAAIAPHLTASAVDQWATALAAPLQRAGIATEKRLAMFLGQMAEESEGFTELVEDLNYSPSRLRAVWPSRFPTISAAVPYARNPEKLANHVYAGRDGNGDEASGDGWRFRGRGLIDTTGRSNYAAFSIAAGKPIDVALAWVETPEGAAAAACFYWISRGELLALSDDWDVAGVTRRVNGGSVNLQARINACGRALAALADTQPAPPAAPPPKVSPAFEPLPIDPPAGDPAAGSADALMQAELDQLNAQPPAAVAGS